jgi:hypothetical protein
MDLSLLAARVEQINTFVATRAITTKNEIIPFAPLNAAADFVDLDRVDFSANAQLSEERRNEIQRDGNNDILVCLPPLCNVALQAQGFHISNLRPTKVEKPYYTSTGAEQEVTDDYRTNLRSLFILSGADLLRLNQTLSDYLDSLMDMSLIKTTAHRYSAAQALQTLNIILADRTYFSRAKITEEFSALSIRPIRNNADLLQLQAKLHQFSVFFNILAGRKPFQIDPTVFLQIAEAIQNSIPDLPSSIQADVRTAIQHLKLALGLNAITRTSVFVTYLSPIYSKLDAFQSSTQPQSHSLEPPAQIAAMMARESVAPRVSADSGRSASDTVVQFEPAELAFVARQASRHDSRKDFRQDSRTGLRQDSRKDFHPDSRRMTPSWDRRSDSQERPRLDRPSVASGTLRMDDDDRHELLRIQQQLQSLVSKVSGKTTLHSALLAEQSSAAPPEAAFHTHIASSDSDADADYRN